MLPFDGLGLRCDSSTYQYRILSRQISLLAAASLSTTERSDSPSFMSSAPSRIAVPVLNAALSVLEDSQKADWRAPELRLLLQHFDLFITRCFQGAFMGRAISFRVDIIKAQTCSSRQHRSRRYHILPNEVGRCFTGEINLYFRFTR